MISCFIIITGLVEAIWGLMQLYGFRPSQHNLFKLTGSFFNPGPYAGYLAVTFPLALQLFWKSNIRQLIVKSVSLNKEEEKRKISWEKLKIRKGFNFLLPFVKKCLGGLTCVAILLVVPAAMSRASWLAVIAGSIVVIVGNLREFSVLKKNFLKFKNINGIRLFLIFFVICLLLVIFAGMYYLKKDSADGRLLTWKVSISALAKHPQGVGLGHFPNAYGEAQAAYFASGNASEADEYLAGNPEYGFNEFLQIGIESGVISLLLFVCMLICTFRGLFVSKNWGLMGSLSALLIFACFSYPFSVLPFLVVFVFLLAMSGSENERTPIFAGRKSVLIRSMYDVCVPIICTIVTVFCLRMQYPVFQAFKQWKNNQIYYRTSMYGEVVQSYEPLYPYLNDQINFLFEYGRSLNMAEQPEKSNEVLCRAMQISCDPMLYNIMGKNFQAMKEYGLAEESLRKSSLIVPNRIYPHYLLMLLFDETGETDKAKAAARIVLTKEPKVQSTAVAEMREEARKIMIND